MVRFVAGVLLSVFLCVLLGGCGKPGETSGGDSDGKALNIVGVWQQIPVGNDPPDFVAEFTYEFTETEMTIKRKGKLFMGGTYKIDESKRPRIITYRMTKMTPDTTVERQINLFMDELSIGSGDNLVKLKRVSK